MRKLFTTCIALATIGLAPTAFAQDHRGSIQIQGPDIEQNYRNGQGTISFSWAQGTPLTKKMGRQELAKLENQLTAKQKADRRSALDSAIRYINQCPNSGCDTAARSWPGSNKRVDIEIRTGKAFTGTAPR